MERVFFEKTCGCKKVCLFFCCDTVSCSWGMFSYWGRKQWVNGTSTNFPYDQGQGGVGRVEDRAIHTIHWWYWERADQGDLLPHTSCRAPCYLRQIPSLKFHHGHKIKGRFTRGLHSFHTEDWNLPIAFPSKSTWDGWFSSEGFTLYIDLPRSSMISSCDPFGMFSTRLMIPGVVCFS